MLKRLLLKLRNSSLLATIYIPRGEENKKKNTCESTALVQARREVTGLVRARPTVGNSTQAELRTVVQTESTPVGVLLTFDPIDNSQAK